MASLYRTVRPLLFRAGPERAHGAGIALGRIGQRLPGLVRALHRAPADPDGRLRVRAFGLDFENPIGVAAGLDKNAELVPLWTQIGCGFSEVGSVTARPSDGNPRPRAFRLPLDEALVNRMGLNNQGAARVAERIAALGPKRTRPLAINVAKTHDPAILGDAALDDFAESTQALLPLADVLVLNVSCPNTAEGKTFEDPGALDALLERVMAVREGLGLGTPVLVKLSPPPAADFDPGPVDELIDLSRSRGVAGFVATNTASDRAGLERTPDREVDAIGRGGLSGAPLRARALALLAHLYRRVGDDLPLIGVGGIDSPAAVYERIRAGASLVELYTGLVYAGPGLVARSLRALRRALERDGLGTVQQAVGADADRHR